MRAVVHGVACRRTGDVKFTRWSPCGLRAEQVSERCRVRSRLSQDRGGAAVGTTLVINALTEIRKDGTASYLQPVTRTQHNVCTSRSTLARLAASVGAAKPTPAPTTEANPRLTTRAAGSAPQPWPPPPHPDISTTLYATPGCNRQALYMGGLCCFDCGHAAQTGMEPCHCQECDAHYHDPLAAMAGHGSTGEPAPPDPPTDTGASSDLPGPRTTPPPRSPPLPTMAPRRTPTPTPTPLPSWLALRAAPDAPPPQQSPARRQAPCPLLWCLLIGATALACLPTDVTHHA